MSTRILMGDVREKLRELADESVHCVVTSPPYWGLRNYGVDGQIGLETTLAEHIAILVDVFREVRRVLRKDGTCWMNYGDAYCSTDKWGGGGGNTGKQTVSNDGSVPSWAVREKKPKQFGLKPKDRMLLPARVAIALCDDGWWVRDEIVWHKPNPMPSSVKDRTTPAHEMIYMLTRSARYAYDADAIRTPFSAETKAQSFDTMEFKARDRYKMPDGWDTGLGAHGKVHRAGREKGRTAKQQATANASNPNTARTMGGFNERWDAKDYVPPVGANKRSVWTVAPQAFPGAHFATFPPKLIEPCILAGCPVGGTVLDPFFGAGTTGLVAQQHGRNCIGIELNPEYAAIARERLGLDATQPRLVIDLAAARRELELVPLVAALQARLRANV